MKNKDASTINDAVYYELDKHANTISDSSKPDDASNEPITDTHIVDGMNDLSVGNLSVGNLSVGIVTVDPAVIGVRIIGQGITQGVINRSTHIGSNIVTYILTNSSKQLFETNTFQLNLLHSETLVIGSQDESVKRTNRIISMSIEKRNISRNRNSRIVTPLVNKDVWSVINMSSNGLSDADNVKKFDTSVQSYTTQERNMESSRIDKESLKIIFPKLGTELEPSLLVNIANSAVHMNPKFKSLRHPPIDTEDIWNLEHISATRPKSCNGLRRSVDRDDRLGYTHDFETMSKTTSYRNHINNLGIET